MGFSRRHLLRRATAVAGGLFFADILGLERVVSASSPRPTQGDPDGDDPNFLHARIESIRSDTIVSLTPRFATRLVRVSPQTEIWRTVPVSLGDLRPGDFFYARGVLDEQGFLNADSIWANIVNLTGTVSFGSDRRMGELMLPDRRIYHVHMTPNVELYVGNVPVAAPSALPAVLTGPTQVLGMWDERTGTIEVTSCWA